jgi:hypothetical protein
MDYILQALRWHRHAILNHPHKTNAATSAILMLIGDRVAQHVERDTKDGGHTQTTARASWTRTAILTCWSAGVSSPFYTWWYKMLHRRLPHRPVTWVALTAVVPAPAFNLAFFAFSTCSEYLALRPHALQNLDVMWRELHHKVNSRWWQTVVCSTQVWGVVNYVNFRFVPLDYRMLFGSAFALAWSVYLSLQQHAPEYDETSPFP